MTTFITVLSLLLTAHGEVVEQSPEEKMYRDALLYLDKSVVRDPSFVDQCKQCCAHALRPGLNNDLYVADSFVANNKHLPLCDFLQRRYGMRQDCNRLTPDSQSATVRHVLDSLEQFWEGYMMKPQEELATTLSDLIGERKDGYQVFFSDVYRNTIAAEVKSFCVPYDKKIWTGGSISFFFVFNESGEILEIYSGATVKYN